MQATGAGSDPLPKELWDIYVAEDDSGEQSTKGIRVTAKPVSSNALQPQELRTSIDQLKTLMLYLAQIKVPRAQELLEKFQNLVLLDDQRNFAKIRSVLDTDGCAHLGKCVVEQLCWNQVERRLAYRDAMEIATMKTSNAIRISSSPSLKKMFLNVQSVSCLHASLVQNRWWTTIKEEPSHTKDGKIACRGLVVCAADRHNDADKQMIHLAAPALADFAQEVDVNIYNHIASKIKALDHNGNYSPMSILNIHQRQVLAHLVMQHVTFEDGCVGFTFHEMIAHKGARSSKQRRFSQNSMERVQDVEYLLKEIEFEKSGISRKQSIFSDLEIDR